MCENGFFIYQSIPFSPGPDDPLCVIPFYGINMCFHA